MKFLIQTINGNVQHDFSFTLLKAIEYHIWAKNPLKHEFAENVDHIKEGLVPVGSVEFVQKYLSYNYGKITYPKNVPEELFSFAKRDIFNGTEKDIDIDKHFFKSNDKIKGFSINKYIFLPEDKKEIPKGNYQISDNVEIDSEWRVFVYQGKMVGLQNYLGDFTIFPSIDCINKMINSYSNAPVAYTLDVGVYKNNTFVVEVHDFFSCSLYGFEDLKLLPYMFSRWFYEFINIQ